MKLKSFTNRIQVSYLKKKDKQHSGKVGVEWKGIIMGECTCYPWKEENKYK